MSLLWPVRSTRCPACVSGTHFPKRYDHQRGWRLCTFHTDLYEQIILHREELRDPRDKERLKPEPFKRVLEMVEARHRDPSGKALPDGD